MQVENRGFRAGVRRSVSGAVGGPHFDAPENPGLPPSGIFNCAESAPLQTDLRMPALHSGCAFAGRFFDASGESAGTFQLGELLATYR
jgi:hypothetical protein